MQLFKLDDRLWADSLGRVLMLISAEDCPCPRERGGHPELIAGIVTFTPGQRLPQEGFTSHEGAELSLVLAGELVIGTEDGERAVKSGELALIERGALHYSENRAPAEARVLWVIAPAIVL